MITICTGSSIFLFYFLFVTNKTLELLLSLQPRNEFNFCEGEEYF